MGNKRSMSVVPKKGTPKTTKMDERKKKPANKTGKSPSMYPKGKYP